MFPLIFSSRQNILLNFLSELTKTHTIVGFTNNLDMNKTMFFLLFLPMVSFAQQYEVTQDGLRDKSNLENPHLVIETPDKTSSELYVNSLKYINEKYKNPDEVIKGKTENEYLRFETYVPQFTKVNNSGAKLDLSMKYTTELRFKD